MARYDDEAELFAEDYQAGYVRNLLRLQQEVIKLPDSEEHYDIYLARKLYPVLLPGVELLAREIDRLTNKESQGTTITLSFSIQVSATTSFCLHDHRIC